MWGPGFDRPAFTSVASPICQEGQRERTFLRFAFSSQFFLFFSRFSPLFPDFSLFLIFGKFFTVKAALRHCPYLKFWQFQQQKQTNNKRKGEKKPFSVNPKRKNKNKNKQTNYDLMIFVFVSFCVSYKTFKVRGTSVVILITSY